ncbi:hypothetical protein GW17_00050112, partial [Ensete ventricosum]
SKEKGGRPRPGPLQGCLATRKGVACYSQGQLAGAAPAGKSAARKGYHFWAEAPPAKAAAYGQKRHPQGLPPTASKGSDTRSQSAEGRHPWRCRPLERSRQ